MRVVCLNMDLGPGRSLQDADLSYLLASGAEVICHTNSNGMDVPEWDDFHFGNAGITSLNNPEFKKVGFWRKWAATGTLDNYTFLVLDFKQNPKLPAVVRRIKSCSKDQRVVLVAADWSALTDKQFSELRSLYAFYGHHRDGVFITDASVVTNIVRLGVTHSGSSVIAVDIK